MGRFPMFYGASHGDVTFSQRPSRRIEVERVGR